MYQSHFLLSLVNLKTVVILCLQGNPNTLHCGSLFEIRHREPGLPWERLGFHTLFPGILKVLSEPKAGGISTHFGDKHLYAASLCEMDLLREKGRV